jgi:hypothetical protein
MISDTLESYRAANRRVANLAARQSCAESPDAETKRSKAAAILNALRAYRTIRTNKTMELSVLSVRRASGHLRKLATRYKRKADGIMTDDRLS